MKTVRGAIEYVTVGGGEARRDGQTQKKENIDSMKDLLVSQKHSNSTMCSYTHYSYLHGNAGSLTLTTWQLLS